MLKLQEMKNCHLKLLSFNFSIFWIFLSKTKCFVNYTEKNSIFNTSPRQQNQKLDRPASVWQRCSFSRLIQQRLGQTIGLKSFKICQEDQSFGFEI